MSLQRTVTASRLVRSTTPLPRPHRFFHHTPRSLDAPRAQLKPASSSPRPPPSSPRRNRNDQLPVLPLVIIFCLGSASFYWLTKAREGTGQKGFVLPEKAPEGFKEWPRNTISDQTVSRR